MKYARRTDASQSSIVSVFRQMGKQVIDTSGAGKNFPDLVVGDSLSWVLVEIKETSGCLDRGQLNFISSAKGPVAVVTSEKDAEKLVKNGFVQGNINRPQKDKIAAWLVQNPGQESIRIKKFFEVVNG